MRCQVVAHVVPNDKRAQLQAECRLKREAVSGFSQLVLATTIEPCSSRDGVTLRQGDVLLLRERGGESSSASTLYCGTVVHQSTLPDDNIEIVLGLNCASLTAATNPSSLAVQEASDVVARASQVAVFVNNLPWRVSEAELGALLGTWVRVDWLNDSKSGRFAGKAIVVFEDLEKAKKAVANVTPETKLNGRQVYSRLSHGSHTASGRDNKPTTSGTPSKKLETTCQPVSLWLLCAFSGGSYKRQEDAISAMAIKSASAQTKAANQMAAQLLRKHHSCAASSAGAQQAHTLHQLLLQPELMQAHFAQQMSQSLANPPPRKPQWEKKYNFKQRQVLAVSTLALKPAECSVTLIQGPPGTGKTTTAVEIVVTWLEQMKTAPGKGKSQILVSGFSNIAVDNIMTGLLDQGVKCLRVGHGHRMSTSTLQSEMLAHPNHAKIELLRKEAKGKQASRLLHETNTMIMDEAEVLCATCITTGSSIMAARTFTKVLVDEATQSTEPAVVVPLSKGCKQLVLIGDQKQLPPLLMSHPARLAGLGKSLFERLVEQGCPVLMMQVAVLCLANCQFLR